MKNLKELLGQLEYTCERGDLEKQIEAVVYDSRKVTKNCLFICIRGANFDGHEAAYQAVKDGAAAGLVCRDIELAEDADATVCGGGMV